MKPWIVRFTALGALLTLALLQAIGLVDIRPWWVGGLSLLLFYVLGALDALNESFE